MFGKYIIVKPMLDDPIMPSRQRYRYRNSFRKHLESYQNCYRTIFKEEQFGGSCVAENFWTSNDQKIIMQHEDCRQAAYFILLLLSFFQMDFLAILHNLNV